MLKKNKTLLRLKKISLDSLIKKKNAIMHALADDDTNIEHSNWKAKETKVFISIPMILQSQG